MGLIGAGVSAIGSIASANAQANAQEQQAAYYDRQAERERKKGAYESAREDRKNRKIAGSQRNRAANSGLSMDTFEAVMDDTLIEGNLDEQAIRYSAETQAQSLNEQAAIKRSEAGATRQAGMFGAISPMIKSVGTMFNSFGY
jgi:multidrug efflux pump subunit AcrA (membrane-fusion protein)